MMVVRYNKSKGFTLIELMIVVAVIGILSSIAIPQYQSYIKKTQMGSALATLSALKISVEDYIASHGDFPTFSEQDMADELGATATILGDIESKSGTAEYSGQLILTLNNQTHFDEQKIALNRDENGLWECITDIAEAPFFPRQCFNGTVL